MKTATWNRVLDAALEGGSADEIARRADLAMSTARRYLREQAARGLVTTYPGPPVTYRSYHLDGVSLTLAQRDAISEQAARYYDDDTPCVGLDSYKVEPASAWEWTDDAPPYPEGAVAVKFHYIGERHSPEEQEHHGLEVTVFAADGSVLDSQDFG